MWALRCVHEAQSHEDNCFITLTYDQEHIPLDGSLDVSHWQKFAKRVRNQCGPFRFFHCGEYGDKNFRPHYHALIFGLGFRSDRELFKRADGYDVFISPQLSEIWGKGFCTVTDLSFKAAAYVARYTLKKVGGFPAEEHYRRLDTETGEEYHVKREYCTMSRRPGLGARWIERFQSDVYPDDFCVHENVKYTPPTFYDVALGRKDPAFLEAVKAARVKRASAFSSDQTADRLFVRSKVTDARLSQSSRDI